jgi:arginine decarboxylase-like protein
MAKSTTEKYTDALDKIKTKETKIEKFGDILSSIRNLDDKKRVLWTEIYHNAVDDRENASILFTDTLMQVKGNAANHNILGPVIAKYLERMSRANDQILKLAELIAREEEIDINPDSIFDSISNSED